MFLLPKRLFFFQLFILAFIDIISKSYVAGDFKNYDPPVELVATDNLVRYTEGFLNAGDERGDAFIDLRQLIFFPKSDNHGNGNIRRHLGNGEDPVDSRHDNVRRVVDTRESLTSTLTVTSTSPSPTFTIVPTFIMAPTFTLPTNQSDSNVPVSSHTVSKPTSQIQPRVHTQKPGAVTSGADSNTNEKTHEAVSATSATTVPTVSTTSKVVAKQNSVPFPLSNTVIDIAVFTEPLHCTNTRKGCDWTELGIGKRYVDPIDASVTNFYCCSTRAVAMNLCPSSDYGRLVVDQKFYQGGHVTVKFESMKEKSVAQAVGKSAYSKTVIPVTESGNQIVIMANCNPDALSVYVTGTALWMSVHGYLPADQYGSLPFFFFVTFLYLILLISYGVGMQRNKENTIDIQRWMIVTIAIGFLEALFRAGDLFAWNATGFRESFFMYAGVLIGVLKRSISRCVVIMLCLGWGIVRDNLGPDMKKIVTFGIGYAFLSGVSDILFTIALTSPKLGETGGSQLLSIVEWIVVGVTGLNLICYCWILESLSNTMQYLKNNNQVIKNRLFEKLRMCLLFSALFAICWTAIGFVDMYVDDRLFGKEQEYLITTMWEINYLYILIYVALIFRPNKNAKFYAYVMELPSIPEGEEHDLDFVVGSDDEDDDDDDDDELYRFKKEFDPDDSDEEGIGFEMGTRQNGLVLT